MLLTTAIIAIGVIFTLSRWMEREALERETKKVVDIPFRFK